MKYVSKVKNVDSKHFKFKWNPAFENQQNKDFEKAQKYVDSECVRLMVPYTPMKNGPLYKSAKASTPGKIIQTAPYARYQYYGLLMVSSKTGSSYATEGESKVMTSTPLNYSMARHPQSGKMWFDRMKADKKQVILRGAARMAGGKQ